MNEIKGRNFGIYGSTLKIIGCLLMAIDHIGHHMFPKLIILRIIGRLSMPIFAYLIAEGCHYTKNKLKHFLLILISGLICLFGVYIATDIWFGNIFLNFAVSTVYIYLIQYLKKFIFNGKHKILRMLLSIIIFILCLIPTTYLFKVFPFDYGFLTSMVPVAISLLYLKDYIKDDKIKYIDNKYTKIFICSIVLILFAIKSTNVPYQWYSLLAIPLLLLYNEEPGCKKLKYFFYLFYPLHIILILVIKQFII